MNEAVPLFIKLSSFINFLVDSSINHWCDELFYLFLFMELVPIISLTLKVVAIVAAVAIIISYFSYKVKEKMGKTPRPSIEIESKPKINVIPKNDLMMPQFQKPAPPAPVPISVKPIRKALTFVKEKANRITHHDKPRRNDQKREESKGSRLEILNKAEQNSKSIPHHKKEQLTNEDKPKQSLGGEVIDKYLDSEDQAMFTLKTGKKEGGSPE